MRDIVSRVYPTRIKSHIRQLLLYNGVEFGVERVLAVITGVVLGIACILALLLSKEYGVSFNLIFYPSVVVLIIGVYSALMLLADSRGNFVESILPDVLKLMSSNLRAGLTIDRSLIQAARPEFGFFQKEINQVAGKIVSGKSFEEALSELGSKIKSKNLEITVDLIVQGIRSGGSLASSLDRIADILRDREFVQKEIKAGVQMYVVFIMFAIMIGAPLLFGMSTFMVSVLEKMSSNIAGSFGSSGMSSLGIQTASMSLPISLEFLMNFSLISLISTSLLGAIVVGLVNTGNWKNGIKYMPVFSLISLGFFYVMNRILAGTIGSML